MSLLDPGTEIIVAVNGDWYRDLARQQLLPTPVENSGGAEILMGKVDNSKFPHGLLLVLDPALSQLVDPNFFIPWHVILAIAVANEAERREVGFLRSANHMV